VSTSVPISPSTPTWDAGADIYTNPEPALVRGLLWRRPLAYAVDVGIIAGIWTLAALLASPLWVLSFGTLSAPLAAVLAAIPLAYHSLLIGGRYSATLGQRLFNLEIRRLDGGRPSLLQAFVQTVLFYVTIAVMTFLILVPVFNRRRRAVHDMLAGTITLRRLSGPELLLPGARP